MHPLKVPSPHTPKAFNNDFEKPSFKKWWWFTPPVNKRWNEKKIVCHYQIEDGIIHFCLDCSHSLAGQRVKLPELPPQYCEDDP